MSGTRSDLLFTHNDSGDEARFFAVDRTGRTRGTYVLKGVTARDWEDISRGPMGTLWLGDIGDNRGVRGRGVLVHRVPEPGPSSTRLTPTTYRLRYEDGPRDAEALMVTPRTGRVFVVEKTLGSTAGVYATERPLRAGGVVNLLRRVGAVPVSSVTGGDISPDGRRVALRNYTSAYEWDIPGGDVVGAFRTVPTRVPLPSSAQGEGITYRRDGQGLLTSSEGARAPVYELRRSVASPSAAAAPAPVPAPAQRTRWFRPVTAAGAAAVIALLALVLLRRRTGERRRAG